MTAFKKILRKQMPKKDVRVDQYIAKSKEFAQPILNHIRATVHAACPDIEETIKWGFPHFLYKGILCSMASFKEHCAFVFWKATLMKDKSLIKNAEAETAMGHFGKIKTLSDLPSQKKFLAMLKEAIKLNEEEIKLPSIKKSVKEQKEIVMPDDFLSALGKNKKAKEVFESFSYSHKKEYVEWIVEAKREETRGSRIIKAIEMLKEGKSRNWKYEKK